MIRKIQPRTRTCVCKITNTNVNSDVTDFIAYRYSLKEYTDHFKLLILLYVLQMKISRSTYKSALETLSNKYKK